MTRVPQDRVADPARGYSLDIPRATSAGLSVEIVRDERDGRHRLHLQSPDASEVYVEIVTYPSRIAHGPAVAEEQRFLRERSPTGRLTEPVAGVIGRLPATVFDFDGPLGDLARVRRFAFVDSPLRTYRIVFDPTSATNVEVIDTFALEPVMGR
jgi:hypothetical protein